MNTMMGGSMMAIMLFFMMGMYKSKQANIAIFIGAAVMLAARPVPDFSATPE